MLKRAITHRDGFIMAQALIFALEALRRLPEISGQKAISTT
jgi:hypothetical protein